MTEAQVVLVHGLWLGAWSWDAVRDSLHAAGIASTAVELPLRTLDEDVAVVRAALDAATGPVVLAGHSYGGAVITAAGMHGSVRHLVYLAAFALLESESVSRVLPELRLAPTRLADALVFSADRAEVSIGPTGARELLYGQAGDAAAEAAIARLRPVSRALFSARPPEIAWRVKPSTYAVCAEDRCVSPQLQRALAERATVVVEWESDHVPMTSHPDLVAELSADVARSVA